MDEKLTIEQSNPFEEFEYITNSIGDINTILSKIEFKSDNGLVVALPNDDSCLLSDSTLEDDVKFNCGDTIDIYMTPEGIAYKNDCKYELYLNVLSKAKNNHIFNGKVVDATQHGLLVMIDGVQSFMPEGQIGYESKEDLQAYVGNNIDVKLINVKLKEKEGNRFLPIVSHKILEDERNAIEAQDKQRVLKVGTIIQGTVKSITSYGVFVTIFPSVDGLIHITDLSWEKVSAPSDVVSVGQNITAIILDMKQTNIDSR